jgi:hypothetical protein
VDERLLGLPLLAVEGVRVANIGDISHFGHREEPDIGLAVADRASVEEVVDIGARSGVDSFIQKVLVRDEVVFALLGEVIDVLLVLRGEVLESKLGVFHREEPV